jgi:hypothetical protein
MIKKVIQYRTIFQLKIIGEFDKSKLKIIWENGQSLGIVGKPAMCPIIIEVDLEVFRPKV